MSSNKRKMDEIYSDETETDIETIYNTLRNIVIGHFDYRVCFLLECCLSVYGAMFLKGIKNPIGLVLIDAPATEKTTVLSFFYPKDDEDEFMNKVVYRTDNFTPKAFVSHAANIKTKDLDKIDLLPRVKNKIMIIPELAPLFGKREEDLMEVISILTRLFDGEGLQTDSGTRGRRGYKGKYFFCLMGATTPFDKKVWKVMGKLGSRLAFLTVPDQLGTSEVREKLVEQLTGTYDYETKVSECQEATRAFMGSLHKHYDNFQTVGWKRNREEDRKWVKMIAVIADLVGRARSYVSMWKDSESYDFKIPVIEKPIRMASILYSLARGHALIEGRQYLNESDMRVVYEVGMSSMPNDHRQILSLILDTEGGHVTRSQIEETLCVSNTTAGKMMETMCILKLCRKDSGSGNQPDEVRLRSEFSVLLDEEFKNLRFRRVSEQEEIPF